MILNILIGIILFTLYLAVVLLLAAYVISGILIVTWGKIVTMLGNRRNSKWEVD